ncbi:MAG: 3-deoxy-manno-octulosonate cytidylyltransferase, partial [Candidatus Omnitrophica bacterium]|nr:3-deoxy-manno-octulosonate cytidylyltransferase [Candidatus Omnitrophota bacterium]
HPSVIDSLVQEMLITKDLPMATVKKKIEEKNQIDNPNIVKVICDKLDFAIYFSRFPIPYCRDQNKNNSFEDCRNTYYKHLGIYAYSKDFLYTFKNLPVSQLEKAEKLEQLRAIEAGYKIKVIETHFDSFGIDTSDDLYEAEKVLMQKGYA